MASDITKWWPNPLSPSQASYCRMSGPQGQTHILLKNNSSATVYDYNSLPTKTLQRRQSIRAKERDSWRRSWMAPLCRRRESLGSKAEVLESKGMGEKHWFGEWEKTGNFAKQKRRGNEDLFCKIHTPVMERSPPSGSAIAWSLNKDFKERATENWVYSQE